jgi:hypothetical protein
MGDCRVAFPHHVVEGAQPVAPLAALRAADLLLLAHQPLRSIVAGRGWMPVATSTPSPGRPAAAPFTSSR